MSHACVSAAVLSKLTPHPDSARSKAPGQGHGLLLGNPAGEERSRWGDRTRWTTVSSRYLSHEQPRTRGWKTDAVMRARKQKNRACLCVKFPKGRREQSGSGRRVCIRSGRVQGWDWEERTNQTGAVTKQLCIQGAWGGDTEKGTVCKTSTTQGCDAGGSCVHWPWIRQGKHLPVDIVL